MSIWGTWPAIDGNVLTYADGFSNHYPNLDRTHELPARVAVADLAPWCVPGHDQDGRDFGCTGCGVIHDTDAGQWLRLDLSAPSALTFWSRRAETVSDVGASVVLDVEAVRSLRGQLYEWLELATVKALQGPREQQKAASDGRGGSKGTPMGSRETGGAL